MFRMTRRRILLSYFILIIVWAIVIIVMHSVLGGWSPLWFFIDATRKLDRNQLKQLMASSVLDEHNATLFPHPLLQLLAPSNHFLHFFSLPKRKNHIVYSEVIQKYSLLAGSIVNFHKCCCVENFSYVVEQVVRYVSNTWIVLASDRRSYSKQVNN